MNKNKHYRISPLRICIYLIAVLAVAVYGYFTNRGYTVGDSKVELNFIDVDQGDCSLIISDDGAVLIDTGLREYSDTVIAYIKRYTDTIDWFVATHPDSDHIGGAADVITHLNVKTVLISDAVSDNTAYCMLLQALEQSDTDVVQATAGARYNVGCFTMTVLAPLEEYDPDIGSNNHSIVVKISYGDFSAMFTGDAEKQEETEIVSNYSSYILRSDVLKVGHHGSKTSSSKAFLESVKPSIAVISCGKDNQYGHPHKTTLNKLSEIGAEIVRTDESGTIIIATDGKGWQLKK